MTKDSVCVLCGAKIKDHAIVCDPIKDITFTVENQDQDPRDYINHEGMWAANGWSDQNPITAEFLRTIGWTDSTEEYFCALDGRPERGIEDLRYIYEWVSEHDYMPQSWFLLKVFWEVDGKGRGPWFELWDGNPVLNKQYYTGAISNQKSFLEHMIGRQAQGQEMFAGTKPAAATNEEAFRTMRDIQQSSIENLSFSDLHQVVERVNGKVTGALVLLRPGIILTEKDRAQAESDSYTYLFMHRRLQAEIDKRLRKLLEHEKEELEGQTAILSVDHDQEDQSGPGPEEDSASSTHD